MMRAIVFAFLIALLTETIGAATTYVARDPMMENLYRATFGDSAARTWSDADQQVLLTVNGKTKRIAEDSVTADDVLKKLRPFLGMPLDLRPNADREIRLPGSVHYEYSQFIAGQPVDNAVVLVDVSENAIIGLFNQSFPGLQLLSAPATLGAEAAKCFAAAAFLGTAANCDLSEPKLPPAATKLELNATSILFAVPPFARRAWAVELWSRSPFASRRYVIDAKSGVVLEMRDRIHHATPRAFVFRPSPFTDKSVKSHKDVQLRRTPDPPYEPVSLSRLKTPAAAQPYLLSGDFVEVKDIVWDELLTQELVASNDGNFEAERGSIGFASSMAYYYITAMQEYVQSLGLKNMVSRPIAVDLRIDAYTFQSAYANNATGTGCIVFGFRLSDGAVFQAEDADVIAHEYGHALQASQALDRFDKGDRETRAISEGFGDYWAMTQFVETKMTRGLDPVCLGEWIKRSAGDVGCDRRIDLAATRRTFSEKAADHENATVWTAALWAIRVELGKPLADKIILASHASIPPDPTFTKAVEAIFIADRGQNAGLGRDALCRIFKDRFFDAEKDCRRPTP